MHNGTAGGSFLLVTIVIAIAGYFLAPAIQAVRDPLFWGRLPSWVDVVYLLVATVVALAVGAWVFSRVDDQIAIEL